MPWQEQSIVELRREFVELAGRDGANVRGLCRRYGISAKTGYKWIGLAGAGAAALADRPRRPHASPRRTAAEVAARVVGLRREHPTRGGRKIHHRLRALGVAAAPSPSTVTAILRRHGLLATDPAAPRPWRRFERDAPNELWQVDFFGHRPVDDGQRARPLTVVDDHSRFALGLFACAGERQELAQAHLAACFARYGLPGAILTDNGPPWGTSGAGGVTALEAWLLRLGVELWHGRARHPQTQGKVERLHGTIAADVFAHRHFPDVAACQPVFDAFRATCNHDRPHEALGYAVPASRYAPSRRPFPAAPPPPAYGPDDQVRLVHGRGVLSFGNRSWFVGRGLLGLPVAVRPTTADGRYAVVFCHREVATIDLTTRPEV